MNTRDIEAVRQAFEAADAVLITAGAGMGVDSGLPDFRGNEGFWNAYPQARLRGLSFAELANPAWFEQDPALAWAFYGHRLHLYRDTRPHEGFALLLEAAGKKRGGYFVVTSNVDGQFQKAGYDEKRIYEVHGSIHHLQCTAPCSDDIWNADTTSVMIDDAAFRAVDGLPYCPHCGRLARPNILMFGDWNWLSARSDAQAERFEAWLDSCAQRGDRMVVIEMGAGEAVPTIRRLSEQVAVQTEGTLLRINPRDHAVPDGHYGVEKGALDGIRDVLRIRG